jgi:hypothetical protein
MNNITNYLAMALCLVAGVLYPSWWVDGYLETWYLKIGVAVAVYGGLAANIVYLIKDRKNKKK